jgi:hypothetical protein
VHRRGSRLSLPRQRIRFLGYGVSTHCARKMGERQGAKLEGSNIPEFCNEVRVERGDAVMLFPPRCGELLLECRATAAIV